MAQYLNKVTLWIDECRQFEWMTDEQFGELVRMMLRYAESGETPPQSEELTEAAAAFYYVKPRLDKESEKYQKQKERMAANGEKRGQCKGKTQAETRAAHPTAARIERYYERRKRSDARAANAARKTITSEAETPQPACKDYAECLQDTKRQVEYNELMRQFGISKAAVDYIVELAARMMSNGEKISAFSRPDVISIIRSLGGMTPRAKGEEYIAQRIREAAERTSSKA